MTDSGIILVKSPKDADEAFSFLENHPRSAQVRQEGLEILEDPVRLKKLVRKIDFTIAPLLAAVYFLQFLDKTTLSYTAVMGVRQDTHLIGQDYSNLAMLFYVGEHHNVWQQCKGGLYSNTVMKASLRPSSQLNILLSVSRD